MPNPEMFGPASMVLSQTISSFQSFLPSLSDVRKASPDDSDIAGDVRLGEIAATALAVGIGAIASSLVGDPTPAVISAIMAVALICVYETALRGNRPMDPVVKHVEVNEDGSVIISE